MGASAGTTRRSKVKNYRWIHRPDFPERARRLQSALRVGPVVARVLANRGYEESGPSLDTYVHPTLASMHDPFLMAGMDAAVMRVIEAMRRRERITVYGDYDSDGVTSTAILLKTFSLIGLPADYYIPHRMTEGYGLHIAAIDQLAAAGTQVIITVDNGISALEQVRHAQARGIDVVVTDHHQVTGELPECAAVVNPNRADCQYPFKYLAGAGVAFKFAHALLKKLQIAPEQAITFLRSVLDLAAVGTVADLAPLTGENRVIVKHGIQQLAQSENIGLAAMKHALEMDSKSVSTYKIGFQIAPRLNAAGRTDSADICVELLTTSDVARAREIASLLDARNRERRATETEIVQECLRFVEERIDLQRERILVVNGEGWHVGVIGIVASRLMEIYDRPVIVIAEDDGHAKGSARSISGFNMYEGLHQCSQLLIAFGGHPFAAGLQLLSSNIAPFREAINRCAAEWLSSEDLTPTLTIDTPVECHELGLPLMKDLSVLEPYGQANTCPVFSASGLRLAETPRIVGNDHLKLQLVRNGLHVNAIGFGLGAISHELNEARNALIDVAFVPTLNTYLSQSRVELELKDIKIRQGE